MTQDAQDAGPPKLDWTTVTRAVTEDVKFRVAEERLTEGDVERIIANHIRSTYGLSWTEHTVKVSVLNIERSEHAAIVEVSQRIK